MPRVGHAVLSCAGSCAPTAQVASFASPTSSTTASRPPATAPAGTCAYRHCPTRSTAPHSRSGAPSRGYRTAGRSSIANTKSDSESHRSTPPRHRRARRPVGCNRRSTPRPPSVDRKRDLIHGTPGPVLAGLDRAEDGMGVIGGVTRGVAIGRGVAATDLAARATDPQMQPFPADLQTLLTARHLGPRGHLQKLYPIEVRADLCCAHAVYSD